MSGVKLLFEHIYAKSKANMKHLIIIKHRTQQWCSAQSGITKTW